ncbi:MAG: molybdenum-dependent transcriptional regulator, partial [Rubrivivax sp.]
MKRMSNPPPSAPNHSSLGLSAELWLTAGGRDLGGPGRIGLLAAIAAHGSITQAAKAVGMSYKSAWEAVAAMNNLVGAALVSGAAGGRGGGSTQLTPLGARLVARFETLASLHQRYLRLLNTEGVDLDTDVSLLRTLNLRTSASNQFFGSVRTLRQGAVNDEVELELPGGTVLVAQVTRESTAVLQLKVGMPAFALIQASSVLIAADLAG